MPQDRAMSTLPNHQANLQAMIDRIQSFCAERDWDQFHDPKELAIGLITEASELLEIFRFHTKEEGIALLNDPQKRTEIEDELADSLFFVLRFAAMNGIDLGEVLERKMVKNAKKYPVEKARGSKRKYTEF